MSFQDHERSGAPAQTELWRKPMRGTSARAPRRTSAELLALESVVRRVAMRDMSAFGELYDLTVERVFTLAMFLLRNRADAEDVVADVYVDAWRRIDSYDQDRGDALAWLLTMCRSRSLDAMREHRLRTRVGEAYHRTRLTDGGGHVDPPHELLPPHQAITDALLALPPLRQDVLALAFCRGLTHKEIASELSLPVGSVKSHLRRAIVQVRAALDAGADGSSQ